MKKFVGYMRSFGDNEFLYVGDKSFGDWLGLDAEEGSYIGATDMGFIGSAFYAYSCSLLVYLVPFKYLYMWEVNSSNNI